MIQSWLVPPKENLLYLCLGPQRPFTAFISRRVSLLGAFLDPIGGRVNESTAYSASVNHYDALFILASLLSVC